MGVRERIITLYRRLRPAALVHAWAEVLAHCNARWGLGLDEATLQAMALDGAATGRDPGDVLAELLRQQARA
jgi:hypothetical protein